MFYHVLYPCMISSVSHLAGMDSERKYRNRNDTEDNINSYCVGMNST